MAILYLLCIITNPQFASTKIDSIKAVISANKSAIDVCNSYQLWGEILYNSNPDSSIILFKMVRAVSEQNLTTHRSDSLKTTIFLHILSDAFNNLGTVYDDKGDIPKSLEYYFRSLRIEENLKDPEGIAISLNNLGYIYINQGDFEKGLEYYKKSLTILQDCGNLNMVATSLNNIGYIYNHHINIDSAINYYLESLNIREEIQDKKGIAQSLNNIGACYKTKKEYQLALEYYFKSKEIRDSLGDKKLTMGILYNIADLQFSLGQIENAKMNANQAMLIAMDLNFPDLIKNAADLKMRLFKFENNYEQALLMFELYIQMRDSINNEATQKATIRQQTKYEYEKVALIKEQETKEQARLFTAEMERRNNLQYSIIFICILILFGIILAFGFIPVSSKMAGGIIFFSFLILFEFILVLADPYIDTWTGGAPGYKLLFNAVLAGTIFPVHGFCERLLRKRLLKKQEK